VVCGAEALAMTRPSRLELILLVAIFLVHAAISFQGIGELFLSGHQGYNGAIRSGIARHYREHGLIATGGRPIKNTFSIADPKNATVHWHHPPLVNLLVAGSFAIFGESEAAARAVPIAASLASFWLIFLLVRRRYGRAAALVSVAVFALLPMQVEYGKMVNYEPLVTCFVLLSLYFLDRLRHAGGGIGAYAGMVAAACLACACDWPGFLFAAALGIEAIARAPRKPIALLAVGVTAAAWLVFVWSWLDSTAQGRGLTWLAEFRVGADTPQGTFEALLEKTHGRLKLFFGWITVITAAAWIVYEAVRRRRLDQVVGAFLPMTAIYFCVFRQGAVMHLFFYYYLVPVFAVAAGVGVVELARLIADLGRWLGRRTGWRGPGEILPRRPAFLSRAVSPLGLGIAIALVWGGFFLATQLRSIDRLAWESYRYYGPTDRDLPRGLPAASIRSAERGDFIVFRERHLARDDQASLAARYPLVRTIGYLIYDLRRDGEGPSARQLDYRVLPETLSFSYFRSSFYPPFRLEENPAAARSYLEQLGLGAAR
jgi:hypothetical protein